MSDEEKNVWFDGHTVHYTDESKHGMQYLRDDLDSEETRVFFHEAQSHGEAAFEDKNGRNFMLKHQNDSSFEVVAR